MIPSRIDLAKREGYFYVADVYVGTGMERIERGTVKSLRVVESPEKRFWTQPAWDGGTGQQAPGMAWDDFNNKRILGTVPVEEDGSAYFAVPADTFVYFQLLDERGMMIQSMRSGTIVRPGETVGCVGCHENRRTQRARGQTAAGDAARAQPARAVVRPAAKVQLPGRGPAGASTSTASRCHDYGQEAGKKLNLAGDLGLASTPPTSNCGARDASRWPAPGRSRSCCRRAGVRMPAAWPRCCSRATAIRQIDGQVKLDPEGFDRIVTWIDINAPYYPEYASAYRDNLYGRSPLDDAQLGQLVRLTGTNLRDRGTVAQVSFSRPELSPCLATFPDKNDPKYQEALAILRAGRQMLQARPRADMPGFQLVSDIEIRQEAKYRARLKLESEARSAILSGKKMYERP